ncbi:MAG TPA: hypothetical protein VHZ07_06355 [Bryobacteraceae bacterium]|jgi:hypothetical protein|nr:hypothetical protein [Bryobacteraceae bacterium]
MSTSSVNNLASSELQSILSTALQGSGSTNTSSSSSLSATSLQSQPDNSQLSPLAQLMSTLQQLQKSNPTEYRQLTQQIASNLQSAAQSATSGGNTPAASELNQLATDFASASQSGQLPNAQDLAKAMGGHHHHGGGHASSSSTTSDSSSSTDSSSSSPATSTGATTSLTQILAAYQTSANQNEMLNPLSIISGTLSNAGIEISNS